MTLLLLFKPSGGAVTPLALSAVTPESASFSQTMAALRTLAAIDAETVFVQRSSGVIRSAIEPSAVRLITAAGLLRSFATIQSQATVLVRLVSVIRSAIEPSIASAIAHPAKLLSLSLGQAQVGFLTRQMSHIVTLSTVQAPRLVRLVGYPLALVGAQAVALLRMAGIIRSAAGPSTVSAIARNSQLKTINAISSASISLLRSLSHSTAMTSSEVVALLRQTSRLPFTTTLLQAVSSVRMTGLVRSAIDASVTHATAIKAKLLPLSLGQSETVSDLRTVGRLLALAAAEAVTLLRLTSVSHAIASVMVAARFSAVAKKLAVAAVEVATLLPIRVANRALAIASVEVVAVVRATGRSLPVIANSIVRGLRSISLHPAVLTGSAIALTRQMASHFAVQQASGLSIFAGRLTFIVRSSALFQALASSAKIGTRPLLLFATSPAVSAIALGRSWIAKLVSPSAASIIDWIHRFLPLALRRRVVRLPPSGDFTVLPGSIRRVVLPREEGSSEVLNWQVHNPEPAYFSPFDPEDEEQFCFDWTVRGYANDSIVFASVVSSPSGVNFLGPAFIDGQLVEITIGPFSPPVLPATYSLRCTAHFASGRRSTFSVPFVVMSL